MRDYIWRYPRGSYIQESWFDLGNPGLKPKIEGVRNQRHNELGCNDASLYRRFHQAGLTKVKMFPQLAIFTPATEVLDWAMCRTVSFTFSMPRS